MNRLSIKHTNLVAIFLSIIFLVVTSLKIENSFIPSFLGLGLSFTYCSVCFNARLIKDNLGFSPKELYFCVMLTLCLSTALYSGMNNKEQEFGLVCLLISSYFAYRLMETTTVVVVKK